MSDGFSLIICIAVTFCLTWIFTEPNIYPRSVEYAEKVCASNDGWARIKEGRSDSSGSVTCKNGAVFDYAWRKLGVEK